MPESNKYFTIKQAVKGPDSDHVVIDIANKRDDQQADPNT